MKIRLSLILVALLIGSSMFLSNPASGRTLPTFKDGADIKREHDAVNSLYARGVFSGYPVEYGQYEFRPMQAVTRAEAAKMITNILGWKRTETTEALQFTDVPKEKWYYEPIAILVEKGILSGYGNGEMKPEAELTRWQMAKILTLSFDYSLQSDVTLPFKDVSSDSEFAPFVKALYDRNITEGTKKGTFSPYQKVTRHQLVIFLYRAHQQEAGNDYNAGEIQNLVSELQTKINDKIQKGKAYKPDRIPYYTIRQYFLSENLITENAVDTFRHYYETSCTACDHILFDIPMEFDLYFDILEQSNERITVETVYPANELDDGQFEQYSFVYQEGNWALDVYKAWSFEKRPLNLTSKQAQVYLNKTLVQYFGEEVKSIKFLRSSTKELQDPNSQSFKKITYHVFEVTTDSETREIEMNAQNGYVSGL